jgi:hypothetical protein
MSFALAIIGCIIVLGIGVFFLGMSKTLAQRAYDFSNVVELPVYLRLFRVIGVVIIGLAAFFVYFLFFT